MNSHNIYITLILNIFVTQLAHGMENEPSTSTGVMEDRNPESSQPYCQAFIHCPYQAGQLIKMGLINNITEITSKQVNILKQEPCVSIPSHQELRKRLTAERLQLNHFLKHTTLLRRLNLSRKCNVGPLGIVINVRDALIQYEKWMSDHPLILIRKGWGDMKEIREYDIIAALTKRCFTPILREIYEEHPEALTYLYALEIIEDPYGPVYDMMPLLTQSRVYKLKKREEWEAEMTRRDQEFLEYEQKFLKNQPS